MEASIIKRGDVLETKSVSLTSCGDVRDNRLIAPGTRVKVIRAEKSAYFKCEVQPVERDNGPVFVWLWASELRTAERKTDNTICKRITT